MMSHRLAWLLTLLACASLAWTIAACVPPAGSQNNAGGSGQSNNSVAGDTSNQNPPPANNPSDGNPSDPSTGDPTDPGTNDPADPGDNSQNDDDPSDPPDDPGLPGDDPNDDTDPGDDDPPWDVDPADLPTFRYEHTMTTVGERVYVFGGLYGNVGLGTCPADFPGLPAPAHDDLWSFNDDNNEFALLAPDGTTKPSAMHAHIAAAHDGKLYIHGGKHANGSTLRAVWAYDPATNSWSELSTGGPALSRHAGVVVDGKWIIVGGTDGASFGPATWVYDFVANTWTRVADCPAGSLNAPIIGEYEGTVHVIGSDAGVVHLYDVIANAWQTQATGGTAPAGRTNAGFCQFGPFIIVIGGAGSSGPLQDSFTYDMQSSEYKSGGEDLPEPAYAPRIALSDPPRGLVYGGMDTCGDPIDGENAAFGFRLGTKTDD